MRLSGRGLFVLSLLVLSACASSRSHKDGEVNSEVPGAQLPPAQIKEQEPSSEKVEQSQEQPYKSAFGEIALDDNAEVDKWINYFQGRGRGYMEQYLHRSTRYLPMMKEAMREEGLPEDLVYIALIESGFSPRAQSRANAVGYWQFIRGTGKRFGLQIDTFTDERRDPVLSTRAAAQYFKELYVLFNSWHLSMAAYNYGEARIKRAVTRYYTRDFWKLAKIRRAFPAETRQYIPKFIAAVKIAKNPEKYGFTSIVYDDPLSYDTVALQSPISLTKLASNLGVDVDEMQLLNPKFRTDFVPISRGSETVVRIPVGRATDALAALSLSVTSQPKILQAEYTFYRIRRGDTLSTVAHRHRTTVSQLRRLNGLSNRTLLRAGRSIRVPDNGGGGIQLAHEEDTRTPSGASDSQENGATTASASDTAIPAVGSVEVEYHTVRRGENLSVIAQRYRISVGDIQRLNGLNNHSIIHRGQKIRVRESLPKSAYKRPKSTALALGQFHGRHQASMPTPVALTNKAKATSKVAAIGLTRAPAKRHIVRRGETLYDVSKRYGISVSQLAKVNNLKINHRTLAGERLVIPAVARN